MSPSKMQSLFEAVIAVSVPIATLAIAQVMLKWQAKIAADMRIDALSYLRTLVFSPWFWLALMLAGVALIAWLLVLRRYPLSYAYPYISLTFPLVALLSVVALGERVSLGQVVGLGLIVVGVALNARYGT